MINGGGHVSEKKKREKEIKTQPKSKQQPNRFISKRCEKSTEKENISTIRTLESNEETIRKSIT